MYCKMSSTCYSPRFVFYYLFSRVLVSNCLSIPIYKTQHQIFIELYGVDTIQDAV